MEATDLPREDVLRELQDWRAALRGFTQLLELDEARLVAWNSSVSAWSPLHHAAHATLANELCLKNLRSLAKGAGLLVLRDATPSPTALQRLEQRDLRRGEAKAPRMVVPPADVDRATASTWHAALMHDLAAFERELPELLPGGLTIPHQILGPLNAVHWARFAAVHTAHHLAIARDALGVS